MKGKEKYLQNPILWKKEIQPDNLCKKYIKESVIERVIFKDVRKLFGIKELDKVEKIVKVVGSNPGMIIDLGEFAGEIGISRQALSNYLYYLELSFIVKSIGNYRGSYRSASRKLKKYYLIHPSFNISLGYEDEGKNVENLVLFKLKARNYWRGGKFEVDFVKEGIPYEVKFRKEVRRFKSMIKFFENFKVKEGYIITKEVEGEERISKKKIFLVPLWKFMIKNSK